MTEFDDARAAIAEAEERYKAALANDQIDEQTKAALRAQLDSANEKLAAATADDVADDAKITALTTEITALKAHDATHHPVVPPVDTTPPSVPGRPSGISEDPDSIELSWAASTEVNSPPVLYRVYMDDGAVPVRTVSAVPGISPITCTVFGFEPGSTHTFRVDAQDTVGNTSAKSLTSAEIKVKANPEVALPTLIGFSGASEKIPGAAERWFDSGDGIVKVAPRRSKASCPRTHASWKLLGDPVPTDAQTINAFKNLLDHDKVEAEHEHDVKYRQDVNAGNPNAEKNLRDRLAIKNAWFDRVERLRTIGNIADVDVVCTMSAWAFQDLGPHDASKYICKADVLGVDLDGDDATVNGFADYADESMLDAIVNCATANYGGRWTVPEHGWNKTTVGNRVVHFKRTIPIIASYGPEEIQIFDNAGWSPLLNQAELNELRPLVQQYNN